MRKATQQLCSLLGLGSGLGVEVCADECADVSPCAYPGSMYLSRSQCVNLRTLCPLTPLTRLQQQHNTTQHMRKRAARLRMTRYATRHTHSRSAWEEQTISIPVLYPRMQKFPTCGSAGVAGAASPCHAGHTCVRLHLTSMQAAHRAPPVMTRSFSTREEALRPCKVVWSAPSHPYIYLLSNCHHNISIRGSPEPDYACNPCPKDW